MWSFGDSESFKLGRDVTDHRPGIVKNLEGIRIDTIHCGDQYSALLSKDGHVYTFGACRSRQLGTHTADTPTPTQVDLKGTLIRKLVVGQKSTVAIPRCGPPMVWGLVGTGKGTDTDTVGIAPTVLAASEGQAATDAACGIDGLFVWHQPIDTSIVWNLTAPFAFEGSNKELCTLTQLLEQLVATRGVGSRDADLWAKTLHACVELLRTNLVLRAGRGKAAPAVDDTSKVRPARCLVFCSCFGWWGFFIRRLCSCGAGLTPGFSSGAAHHDVTT